jgi:hypothetical protein
MITIGIGLGCLIIGIAIGIYSVKKETYKDGYNHGMKDAGLDVVNASYWFATDPKVGNALFISGKKLMDKKGFDFEMLRNSVTELEHKFLHEADVETIKKHLS